MHHGTGTSAGRRFVAMGSCATGRFFAVGSSNFAGWHIARRRSWRSNVTSSVSPRAKRLQSPQRMVELKSFLRVAPTTWRSFHSLLVSGPLGGKPTENERGRRSFLRQSDKIDAYDLVPVDRQESRRCACLARASARRHRANVGPRTMPANSRQSCGSEIEPGGKFFPAE